MTKDLKDLLLKNLCARLPYGVKVAVNQSELQNYDYRWKNWSFDEEPQKIDSVSIYGVTFDCMNMIDGVIGFEYIKPYLFPISSMTEEQEKECRYTLSSDGNITYETVDWCNKNHFDYRGLIPMGLANDATGLNIY